MKNNSEEFTGGVVPTSNFVEADKKIRRTVRKDGMLAVIGSTGLGKSHIRRISIGSLEERNNLVVNVDGLSSKNKEISAALMRHMIKSLTGEGVRQDIVARTMQLKRILMTLSQSHKIILAIDEAQDLHSDTLYALKKMHELGGNSSREFLFSIIFFGKDSLSSLIRPRELGLRIDTHLMQPLSTEEVKKFFRFFGLVLDKTAEKRLASMVTPTPAAIKAAAAEIKAFLPGKQNISEDDIQSFYRRTRKDRVDELGYSLSDLVVLIRRERGIEVNKTTISKSLNGKLNTKTAQVINETIDDIVNQATLKSMSA